MNYNEMTAARCADWLAEKDGWVKVQTERELRDAVKVLATMVHEWELACGLSDAWQKGGLILNRMAKGTRMSNGFDDAVRERMRNSIAAAAVREAGNG